jgi:hypothetical protein
MENHNVRLSEIGADDFARRFSLRAANLMWFLGAGASAAAGIPTAFDMVWEFKQQLFISQRRISPKLVADLANPTIRAQLQAHIDSLGALPSAGAADEYARLFETVYPAEADRRAYLEAKIAGAKPSGGVHRPVLSLLTVRESGERSLSAFPGMRRDRSSGRRLAPAAGGHRSRPSRAVPDPRSSKACTARPSRPSSKPRN